MSIQRWSESYYEAFEDEEGDFVKYDDHQSQLAALREELAERKRKHLRSCQIAIGKSQLAKERHAQLIEAEEIRQNWQHNFDIRGQNIQLLTAERNGLQQLLADAERRNANCWDQGVERAARWVEQRLADFVRDHGFHDPDTGTLEFRGDGAEHAEELDFIAISIRGLKPIESGAS